MKTTFLILAFLAAFSAADVYDACSNDFNTDNCFAKAPEGSDMATCISDRNCEVLVWWYLGFGGTWFEMEGKFEGADDGEHWIAFGLSEDGGRSMGNDAVVACYAGTVGNYWNRVDPFYSVPLEGSAFTDGLLIQDVTVGDGKIACSFLRETVTVITTPVEEPEEVTIDLSQKYYAALAFGKLKDGVLSPHSKTGAAVSDEPKDFMSV